MLCSEPVANEKRAIACQRTARERNTMSGEAGASRASATRYRAMKRQAEEWIGWPAMEEQHFVLPRV
jgi:hypothetical protein